MDWASQFGFLREDPKPESWKVLGRMDVVIHGWASTGRSFFRIPN
jgi:hypothetical protein